MKGKFKISVKNRFISFNFTLERNVTVLTGDSGTGKTKLINMVRDFSEFGKSSGVTLKCDKPCLVLEGRNWENELENTHESIIFVEESTPFLTSYDFARRIKNSDNYYVLVTREPLPQIPYSIDSIKQIRKNGKKSTFESIYKNISVKDISDFPYELAIIEDSKTGFQFYTKASEGTDTECISSNGKSGIVDLLNKNKNKKVIIIADSAALGSEIRELVYFKEKLQNKTDFFLPESFEWLILRSDIFSGSADIQEILENPVDYIDCQEYFSWEQFFIILLVNSTKGKANLEYPKNKSHLPSGYLNESNIDKILNAMKIKKK